MRTTIRNGWPFALCVTLEAIISLVYFNYAEYGTHRRMAVVVLGELTLVAGVCTMMAAMLSAAAGKRWFLMLNGSACSALGLIMTFWTGRIAFRTIATLIVVMAMSLAMYEFVNAQLSRRPLSREWLSGAAGLVLAGFGFVFLAFAVRWVRLDPTSPAESFLWLGSYFGFSAICMLGMTLRLPSSSIV